MPTRYYVTDDTYHTRRRCRRLHRSSDRVTRTTDPDGDPCERCVDEEATESDICTVVKSDGEECGRERPCQYHD